MSGTIPSAEDAYSYTDYNLQNISYDLQTDSILSSEISGLSLTQDCGDTISDLSFSSKADKSETGKIHLFFLPLFGSTIKIRMISLKFPLFCSILVEPKVTRNSYSKEFLLQCKDSELCQQKPKDWEVITHKFPQLLKVTFTF